MSAKQLSREEKIAAVRAMRVTWHTAAEGAHVWVAYRGNWVEGTITKLGRTAMRVAITTMGGKAKETRADYGVTRVRRPEFEGDDRPVDACVQKV